MAEKIELPTLFDISVKADKVERLLRDVIPKIRLSSLGKFQNHYRSDIISDEVYLIEWNTTDMQIQRVHPTGAEEVIFKSGYAFRGERIELNNSRLHVVYNTSYASFRNREEDN